MYSRYSSQFSLGCPVTNMNRRNSIVFVALLSVNGLHAIISNRFTSSFVQLDHLVVFNTTKAESYVHCVAACNSRPTCEGVVFDSPAKSCKLAYIDLLVLRNSSIEQAGPVYLLKSYPHDGAYFLSLHEQL